MHPDINITVGGYMHRKVPGGRRGEGGREQHSVCEQPDKIAYSCGAHQPFGSVYLFKVSVFVFSFPHKNGFPSATCSDDFFF